MEVEEMCVGGCTLCWVVGMYIDRYTVWTAGKEGEGGRRVDWALGADV